MLSFEELTHKYDIDKKKKNSLNSSNLEILLEQVKIIS